MNLHHWSKILNFALFLWDLRVKISVLQLLIYANQQKNKTKQNKTKQKQKQKTNDWADLYICILFYFVLFLRQKKAYPVMQ